MAPRLHKRSLGGGVWRALSGTGALHCVEWAGTAFLATMSVHSLHSSFLLLPPALFQRHRLVMETLDTELKTGVHALSIQVSVL